MSPMIGILDKFEKLIEEINSLNISKTKKESILTLIDGIPILFRNIKDQLFMANLLAKQFFLDLERLQPDLYSPDILDRRIIFNNSEFWYEEGLRAKKNRKNKCNPKRMTLRDALWKACQVFSSTKTASIIINNLGMEGEKFDILYNNYLKWRSN